jgi:2-polyprenyl-3-methyl-5-hydroxy-6-metoxy-1,4-benzoquinol methylase
MLLDTGERVIPDNMKPTNSLLLEHIARYHFSYPYLRGRILDFACGTGYGSMMMAKAGKKYIEEIVSVDIDKDTIEYARKNYNHPLVNYSVQDVVDPNIHDKLGKFDVIVSFETIEHVKDEERFLSNVYQLLKPNGTLIISTPFGQGRGKPCGSPFHVHQLTKEEFHGLFDNYLKVNFYYQKGVLIEPPREDVEIRYPLGIAVCTK